MKFPGVEFLETAAKFRKREKHSSSCVLHKTSHQETSRPSHAVMAKRCTKKCNSRVELLFRLLLYLKLELELEALRVNVILRLFIPEEI